jgi:hypothetical protein
LGLPEGIDAGAEDADEAVADAAVNATWPNTVLGALRKGEAGGRAGGEAPWGAEVANIVVTDALGYSEEVAAAAPAELDPNDGNVRGTPAAAIAAAKPDAEPEPTARMEGEDVALVDPAVVFLASKPTATTRGRVEPGDPDVGVLLPSKFNTEVAAGEPCMDRIDGDPGPSGAVTTTAAAAAGTEPLPRKAAANNEGLPGRLSAMRTGVFKPTPVNS